MRRIAAGITLVLLVMLVAGCAEAPPSGPAGIVGRITSVEQADGGTVLLVEGGSQPQGAVSDKAMVTVNGSTKVFDSKGRPADADSLTEGAQVAVWFEGPVAESYPVQGTAGAVQLTANP